MNPHHIVRVILATSLCAMFAGRALAQPASTPSAEAKGQPAPQGFSVVLVLGDSQLTAVGDNVPQAARRALADMKDFLPYKGYRLLDAQWILGSQRSTSRLRGPDDQEYQLTLRTIPLAGRIQVTFQLQEPGAAQVTIREEAESAARKAEEAELRARLDRLQRDAAALQERLGEKHLEVANAKREIEGLKIRLAAFDGVAVSRGRSVIDTSFNMEIGETVVVGTSRMRGGDKALIALLTAVPRGTKKE